MSKRYWSHGEILAMTDAQLFRINANTNRREHLTPEPKGFVDAVDDLYALSDARKKYANYYAQFLLGNRTFPGQPSKFDLTAKKANVVRVAVRDILFDCAGIGSVVPMDEKTIDRRIMALESEWTKKPARKTKAA